MTVAQEIETLIHEINESWLEGGFDRLARFFHPDIVMVPPGFEGRATGIEACVQGFEAFLLQAKIRDFRESEVTVDCFGATAIATFRFDISYGMNGHDYQESGREIWMFVREGDRWLAVWRTQVPIESKG